MALTRSSSPSIRPAAVLWRLRWRVRGAWAALMLERTARAFWPVLALTAALGAAMLLGADRLLPAGWMALAVGAGGLALVGLLLRGGLRLRLPDRTAALARLDDALPGRPLAALADQQATGTSDPASVALWQAHLGRMAQAAEAARVPTPDLRLSALDPYALRLVALTALVVGLLFGSPRGVDELRLGPGAASGAVPPAPSWEGWVRPPAYTGRPDLYLNDIPAGDLELAQGSMVVLRLYGNDGALSVRESVSDAAALAPDSAALPPVAVDFPVLRAGQIAIDGPGARVWQVGLMPDALPLIAPDGDLTRGDGGEMTLPFLASDDYGLVSGTAQVVLDLAAVDRRHGLVLPPEARAPILIDLPLPYSGDRREVAAIVSEDLSKHPWANLPVQVRLSVTDTLGQQGLAEPLRGDLPARRFFDPLAAAVIEARRDLLWSADNAARVWQVMRAVTHLPEGFVRNERAWLRLRVVLNDLETGLTAAEMASGRLDPALRDDLAEALWEIAELIETGDLASALESLRRAQDRLDEAIRNGADASEIDQLMADLREALNEYMRQLAQEAQRNPEGQTADMQGMQMSGDQMQEMLDRLQQLMEEGRMDEAAELMQMLRQMMENMQAAQGQGGPGQGSAEQQALRDLGETLRQQQELSDDAFRDLQDPSDQQRGQPGDQGQRGQQEGRPGQQGQTGPERQRGQGDGPQGLAERQGALRRQLDQLGQGALPGEGSEAGDRGREALGRAERAMREAERALRDENLPRALDRQAEALEALRDGIRDLGEALAQDQQRQRDQQGEAFGNANPDGTRDPLGRDPGQTGRIGTADEMLGDADPRRQAQDLLEELRRRSGELARPEEELDYLRRLLERF